MRLTRIAYLDVGAFGKLILPSGVRLYTVERPWLGNAPSISCIPEGVYQLRPRPFFRGGYDAIEIMDVPDRSHILIHIANWPWDVEGCVGPGIGLDLGNNQVVSSRIAFGQLMEEFNQHQPPSITIDHVEARLEATY
jgi:hypothetical protein